MKNTERLLEDERYKSYLKRLEEFESDRVFCRHNLEHFAAVARIAYIHVLEEGLLDYEYNDLSYENEKSNKKLCDGKASNKLYDEETNNKPCDEKVYNKLYDEKNCGMLISKDLIYFTSLLHDIGRVFEYENGTSHDEASALIAAEFLKKSMFSEIQKKLILDCIRGHRGGYGANTYLRGDRSTDLVFDKCDVENCDTNDIKKRTENYNDYSKRFIEIFKRSDKESRMCFNCKAYDDCYWSEEKKNHTIKY